MYALYLGFEWLARHPIWTALGVFVFVGTIAVVLVADRDR